MFEVLDRGGLGRKGLWTRGGRELTTPLVLWVHRPERPAPGFAEALFVQERTADPRLQIRLGGTFFAPRAPESADDLPPAKGLPRSAAELEVPQAAVAGNLALVTAESDVAAAAAAEVAFYANGPEYLRSPREFVSATVGAREALGPGRLLAVPGLAAPSNLACLVYAGVDLVDSSRVVLDSARGIFHTSDGSVPLDEADRAACACPACEAGQDVRAHNERALHRELLLVRNHLAHGRLRELVERRLANDPWNTAVVRHLDLRHFDAVEAYTPVSGREILAYSHESLTRPEVLRFRTRVQDRYSKPASARILLLLPCSARKPYSRSRSHRKFRDAILASRNPSVVHEVVVTSPLGLIPRELEHFYPARAYDVPVTGDWNREEAAMVIEDLRAFVGANRYDAVVAHLGAEAGVVREALPEAVVTSEGRPAAEGSLASLTKTLNEMASGLPHATRGQRFAEEMSNVARFQFGDAGRALVEGAAFRGRFPDVHVVRDGVQVAMYTGRGLLSLTLAGGAVLSAKDVYCVEIEDFLPKGNVFAVGVTGATQEIRAGDDVVVRHARQVRAVGTARMNAREMLDAERGEAVRVRHAIGVSPNP
ncbi:MAG TPA: archaeosine synthase subunit alpha [Thermoplasmata archaeon]|nr:archaeosine synthase subunit alpha [Thermoplasmata archaeon]